MEAAEIVLAGLLFWNCSLPCIDIFRPRLTPEPILHWAFDHTTKCYRVCLIGRIYVVIIVTALILRWCVNNSCLRFLPATMIVLGALVACVCNWDAALYFLLLLIVDIFVIQFTKCST